MEIRWWQHAKVCAAAATWAVCFLITVFFVNDAYRLHCLIGFF